MLGVQAGGTAASQPNPDTAHLMIDSINSPREESEQAVYAYGEQHISAGRAGRRHSAANQVATSKSSRAPQLIHTFTQTKTVKQKNKKEHCSP
jgi:hypothetical protein